VSILVLRVLVSELDVREGHEVVDDETEFLVAQIKAEGFLQPILVRPSAEGRYEVVDGVRRLAAAKMVGLTMIYAVVKDMTDADAVRLRFVMNPIFTWSSDAIAAVVERANIFKKLLRRVLAEVPCEDPAHPRVFVALPQSLIEEMQRLDPLCDVRALARAVDSA